MSPPPPWIFSSMPRPPPLGSLPVISPTAARSLPVVTYYSVVYITLPHSPTSRFPTVNAMITSGAVLAPTSTLTLPTSTVTISIPSGARVSGTSAKSPSVNRGLLSLALLIALICVAAIIFAYTRYRGRRNRLRKDARSTIHVEPLDKSCQIPYSSPSGPLSPLKAASLTRGKVGNNNRGNITSAISFFSIAPRSSSSPIPQICSLRFSNFRFSSQVLPSSRQVVSPCPSPSPSQSTAGSESSSGSSIEKSASPMASPSERGENKTIRSSLTTIPKAALIRPPKYTLYSREVGKRSSGVGLNSGTKTLVGPPLNSKPEKFKQQEEALQDLREHSSVGLRGLIREESNTASSARRMSSEGKSRMSNGENFNVRLSKSAKFIQSNGNLLSMISGNGESGEPQIYEVKGTYTGKMNDELPLRMGERVQLWHTYGDGWSLCSKLGDRGFGVVPRMLLSEEPVKDLRQVPCNNSVSSNSLDGEFPHRMDRNSIKSGLQTASGYCERGNIGVINELESIQNGSLLSKSLSVDGKEAEV